MASSKDTSRTKGSFGPARLSVSKKYVFPKSGKMMLLLGGAGSALILLYFLLSSFVLGDSFSSPGALSSNHAGFGEDCSRCHASVSGVLSSKCSTCHEKTGDNLGVYSYSAHYVYRSGRLPVAGPDHDWSMDNEGNCATCHPEHRGSAAAITEVSDAKCEQCHGFGSFDNGHPEFEFARTKSPDDSTLHFTHVRHTDFVLKDLDKRGESAYIEKACLYCHNAQPDGKTFRSLDFDTHCSNCHLTTSDEIKPLVIKDPQNTVSPGVESLEMIRRRKEPGTIWASYTNPNEFTVSGSRIAKSPVYHRDPWVLENLRQLRQTMFGDQGLADLLDAQRVGESRPIQETYNEAIQRLRDYAMGLRSRPEPEVQKELLTIDSLLRYAKGLSSSPTEKLPLGLFGRSQRDPMLSAEQVAEFEDFSLRLTRPCLVCHVVERAQIRGVKASQQTLVRAEFDHRAHILERRCVECHTEIPVERALLDKDTSGVSLSDRSTTHNLPAMANCMECHTEGKASNACVTCHFMHPNKTSRGNLQLRAESN